MGMAAAASGCYSTAIMWLLRAKDPVGCAQLVQPLLDKIGREMRGQVGGGRVCVCVCGKGKWCDGRSGGGATAGIEAVLEHCYMWLLKAKDRAGCTQLVQSLLDRIRREMRW